MVFDQFLDNNLIVMHGNSNIEQCEDRSFQFRQSVSRWP